MSLFIMSVKVAPADARPFNYGDYGNGFSYKKLANARLITDFEVRALLYSARLRSIYMFPFVCINIYLVYKYVVGNFVAFR
ncbi:MAG: hypothetical protein IJ766_10350 [Clostridia bacterium]|nr:hypothetical protein [Clostridia bacterium]